MLSIQHVNFSYAEQPILSDVTFEVSPSEIVGIVGVSGSGKSTLGNLILNELTPDSGTISSTFDLVLPIFQHAAYAFNPKLTIHASLEEAVRYQKQHQSQIQAYRDRLMNQMGLPQTLLSQRPGGLSGGQLQRFNVIRTLMLKPDLLICDEVTANLDVVAEAKMAEELKRYAEEPGRTMLLISHDIAFLQNIVDRMIVLKAGRLVDDFPISQLFEASRHPATQELIQIYTDML
ncbi:ABC transporter ATP-binding protein [Staphylococcus canis]|uniref:ATP-binding cassette domain-containing protein n=1 Tax=Staphylococcus canis TaxID=2724942 RepID=A0ABS0T6S7_9STAP|nr:ATP-binding cassette domain-containing protein [Staphylococcus canis]MBI5974447.1 ATP-binding cassette domain-containing protein [Staphylococcus canis]